MRRQVQLLDRTNESRVKRDYVISFGDCFQNISKLGRINQCNVSKGKGKQAERIKIV